MDLVAAAADTNVTLRLFLTGIGETGSIEHGKFPNRTFARRITTTDLVDAIDGYQHSSQTTRSNTLCYICGPPVMTDGFVDFLTQQAGMTKERVLCEKWW
jgi:NAD(P)H-flavin reductase